MVIAARGQRPRVIAHTTKSSAEGAIHAIFAQQSTTSPQPWGAVALGDGDFNCSRRTLNARQIGNLFYNHHSKGRGPGSEAATNRADPASTD